MGAAPAVFAATEGRCPAKKAAKDAAVAEPPPPQDEEEEVEDAEDDDEQFSRNCFSMARTCADTGSVEKRAEE